MHHRVNDRWSAERVAGALRLPAALVHRIERDALLKLGIGLTLLELLGRTRADAALAALRGRALPEWRRALLDARRIALRGEH